MWVSPYVPLRWMWDEADSPCVMCVVVVECVWGASDPAVRAKEGRDRGLPWKVVGAGCDGGDVRV